MANAERHIVEIYSALFERLSSASKLELLERLAKSIKKGRKSNEKDFFSSFGAFASDKPTEEINKEIRESRKFRAKDFRHIKTLKLENWVERT
ncbi:hypothetical protein SAMN05192553_103310 [Cyclobacterium xiamenense]|uniref:Uncharacterized protein n=1 Tax=Cyclobacterium xiamenense TaxID=1297121 RepID=A0A1H6XWR8_9BACT|nr:hypothetical protein [Cyclobacterium xiamenense]SEJ33471.1 hypothetical protein SAMN05192553_103310 [Cyclobacterium xiamenense]